MGCRCSERRDAIVRAFYKPTSAIREARYVTKTLTEDAYRYLARKDDAGRKLLGKRSSDRRS